MTSKTDAPKAAIAKFEPAKAFTELQSRLKTTSGAWSSAVPAAFSRQLSPERVVKLVMLDVRRNKLLLQCTHASIIQSITNAVALGLEPGGPLGQAYLVPFKNNKLRPPFQYEAQLIIGYRGYVALARRSGEIVSVDAQCIYKNDEYDINFGTHMSVTHKPHLMGDRGELIAVYSVAHFKGGGFHIDLMSKSDVDAIKAMSQSARSEFSPWNKHYAEMAKKTVVRRAAKYWPLCIELANASVLEDECGQPDPSLVMDASFDDDSDGATEEVDEAPAAQANAQKQIEAASKKFSGEMSADEKKNMEELGYEEGSSK